MSCCRSTSSPATTSRSSGSRALKALEGDEAAAAQVKELMAAVDEYIPQPERDTEKPFLMPIEDVFTITGRGTVVTGRVEQGIVNTGDEVEIVGIRDTQKTTVTGVEMFRKILDEGRAGDNIGALLRGTGKDDVERGQVLAKPGFDHPPHRVRGPDLRADPGRGRAAQAVLRRLPARSSTSAPPTSPATSPCRRAPRCACRGTTRR